MTTGLIWLMVLELSVRGPLALGKSIMAKNVAEKTAPAMATGKQSVVPQFIDEVSAPWSNRLSETLPRNM